MFPIDKETTKKLKDGDRLCQEIKRLATGHGWPSEEFQRDEFFAAAKEAEGRAELYREAMLGADEIA